MFGILEKEDKTTEVYKLKEKISVLEQKEKYLEALQTNTANLLADLNFESLTQRVVDAIVKVFDYASAVLFLIPDGENYIYSHTFSNTFLVSQVVKQFGKEFRDHKADLATDNSLIVKTVKENKIYEGDSLPEFISPTLPYTLSKLTQTVLNIKRTISIPVIIEGKVKGVVMFNSRRHTFDDNETGILKVFVNQIEIAIYNATLYEKVNHQVSQLEVKNHDLSSLYNLPSQISKSLDPEEVAQTAVNSLRQDKLMIGPVLSSYDPVTGKVPVHACTENQLSYQVHKIIGDFSQYFVDMNDEKFEKSPVYRAIKLDTLQMTNSLEDFLSPPVPKQFVGVIANILKIKSVVTYPVKTRGVLIG